MKKHSRHSLFKRIPAIKDRQAVTELGRAHLLVGLLAGMLILALLMSLVPGYEPNPFLTIIAIILLALVGLFSLAVSITLFSKRK